MDPGLSWRIVSDGARCGAANMARDHALAQALRPGTGIVRFYRWSPATLSLGRNEPLTAPYLDFLRLNPGIGVVRRPTGGRAVIHDRELTYAAVLPARACGGPREAYRRVTRGLVEGLRHLGVEAKAAAGRALPPDAGPCFIEAAEGEVVVGDRKLVGSAQMRIGAAVLQHGSVLRVADQSPLLAGPGGDGLAASGNGGRGRHRDPPANAVTLTELLEEAPSWEQLVDAFSLGFARALGGDWTRGTLTDEDQTLARELIDKYGSATWTWRRTGQQSVDEPA